MNRHTLIPALFIFILSSAHPVFGQDSASMFVQVQRAKLRSNPRQWAAGVADIKFGDQLTIISRDGDWMKVQTAGGVDGYIHQSAVTSRKIVLSSQQASLADVAVDESQVYLAGKGFNDDVETSYKKVTQKADFKTIDDAQKVALVSDSSLAAFIHTGKLREE